MPPVKLSPASQTLLAQYRWPGNVRQLKSVAEQMSVLEEERLIEPAILHKYLPSDNPDNLPALGADHSSVEFMNEREKFYMALLQKLQLEVQSLKQDVERLQGGVHIQHTIAETSALPVLASQGTALFQDAPVVDTPVEDAPIVSRDTKSLLNTSDTITVDADYEEDLSIPNATDALVRKALKRYENKKDAADALGISERTLYRKIKELQLEE